jgi:hypothetical protein
MVNEIVTAASEWWNELEPLTPVYFECACHSPEHTLRFSWDDEDNCFYTEVFLNNYYRFFKRLWVAIKYVCGYKCRYGHFDCFILQEKDAEKLTQLLSKLQDQKKD